MSTDVVGNSVKDGSKIVGLPNNGNRMLLSGVVLSRNWNCATIEFQYPDTIFNGAKFTEECYYDDMVVIG